MPKTLTPPLADAFIPAEEQPYPVPENWAWVRVNELTEDTCTGFACAKTNELPEEHPDAFPHLRPNNIGYSGHLNLEKVVFIPKGKVESEKGFLEEGDVLFNNTNSQELVGRSVVIQESVNYAFSNHITKIKVNKSVVSPQWFSYAINKLWVDGFFAHNCKKWVGQAGYNQDMLKYNTFIPLPPMAEQRRIVTKLDSLLGKLREARALIQDARDTFATRRAALLHKAFTGELTAEWRAEHPEVESANRLIEQIYRYRETEYKEECERARIQGKKKPSMYKFVKEEIDLSELDKIPETWAWERLVNIATLSGGVTKGRNLDNCNTMELPYLRVANVQDGFLDLAEMKTIKIKEEEREKYLLEKGDVLFTEGGDRDKLGRGTVWNGEIENCIHQNHIFKARISSKMVLPAYLAFVSKTMNSKDYFFANASQSVNLASINLNTLGKLSIPIPPLAEQHEIVRRLESLLAYETEAAGLLDLDDQLDLLEKSILARAFRGELGTHHPAEEPAFKP